MKKVLYKIGGTCIVPLSFFIIGYLLIAIIIQPYLRPLISIYELFSSDLIPEFTDVTKDLMNSKSTVPEEGFFDKSSVGDVKVGDVYGRINITAVDIDVPLLYGATPKCLYNGAGQRVQSKMPGFGKPTMIGGHTIPYFKNLGKIKNGDEIVVTTHYGKFTYVVTESKVGLATDTSAYDLNKKEEQLILFTCYPLDGIGEKEERLFVYASKVKGPQSKELANE